MEHYEGHFQCLGKFEIVVRVCQRVGFLTHVCDFCKARHPNKADTSLLSQTDMNVTNNQLKTYMSPKHDFCDPQVVPHQQKQIHATNNQQTMHRTDTHTHLTNKTKYWIVVWTRHQRPKSSHEIRCSSVFIVCHRMSLSWRRAFIVFMSLDFTKMSRSTSVL